MGPIWSLQVLRVWWTGPPQLPLPPKHAGEQRASKEETENQEKITCSRWVIKKICEPGVLWKIIIILWMCGKNCPYSLCECYYIYINVIWISCWSFTLKMLYFYRCCFDLIKLFDLHCICMIHLMMMSVNHSSSVLYSNLPPKKLAYRKSMQHFKFNAYITPWFEYFNPQRAGNGFYV